MSYPKKSPYKTYRQNIASVVEDNFLKKKRLLILRGESDFLLGETARRLQSIYEAKSWAIERWEAPQMTAERFLQASSATSLFDPETLTFINQAQGKNELVAHLQSIRHGKEIQNAVCLIWRSSELPAKAQKEVDRLEGFVFSCDEPAPWEFRDFVMDRAQYYRMHMQSDAIDLFLEATGNDLFKIDNELNRLSLCFDGTSTPISSAALRPFLGFLREDHVFKLDQFLCQEAYGKALLLMKDLLDRGEKAISLLAILAMHCRKALQIQAGVRQGMTPADLAKALRIPPTVVQSYMVYVQKRGPQGFLRAIRLCHEADRRLKSRSDGDEIWLGQVVWELKSFSRKLS